MWRRTVLVLTRVSCLSASLSCNHLIDSTVVNLCTIYTYPISNFVLKRLESFRQHVRQESGFLIPFAVFIENCRAIITRDGQMVLPDGSIWVSILFESIFELIKIDPIPY